MVRSNMRRTALIPSFGGSTKNRSSLEASLGFTAITGTPRIENGGTFAVDYADGRRNRHNFYVRPDAPQQLAYTASRAHGLTRRVSNEVPRVGDRIGKHGGSGAVIAAFLFSIYDLIMACVSKLYASIANYLAAATAGAAVRISSAGAPN